MHRRGGTQGVQKGITSKRRLIPRVVKTTQFVIQVMMSMKGDQEGTGDLRKEAKMISRWTFQNLNS